ncbi:MAG: hypothetical protein OXT67_04495 [Zetaproteobacteria bacterium]|nr:hypothetical protein [Zetaproteobacteria bacterium]
MFRVRMLWFGLGLAWMGCIQAVMGAGTERFDFQVLPEELRDEILWRAMREDVHNAPQVALVNRRAYQLFDENREILDPYRYSLLPKKEEWIDQAVTAAREGREPEHLEQFLQFEDQQLAQLLRRKQASLVTVQDWQRHGASLIAARAAFKSALWRTTWDVARHRAWRASWDEAWKLAQSADWDASRPEARELHWEVDQTLPWCMAQASVSLDAKPLAKKEALAAVLNVFTTLELPEPAVRGRVAYRVAETVAWLTMLDPQLGVLERAYDVAYTHLAHSGTVDPSGWFDPEGDLGALVQRHFGRFTAFAEQDGEWLSEQAYERRYRFVASYLNALRQIHQRVCWLSRAVDS